MMHSDFKLEDSVANDIVELAKAPGFDLGTFINNALKVAIETEKPRLMMTPDQRAADKAFGEAVKKGERIKFLF